MLQPKRVVRPAGVAPRLVGAPIEPETAPNPVPTNPTKSAAALRAERYRARQNADFNEQEKQRKQIERSGKLVKRDTKAQDAEKRAEMLEELLESGQFPKSLQLLRTKVGFGLFMKGAPQGKGKIVVGDLTPILSVHDNLRIDNLENTAPLRAQLTEEDLRAKLRSQDTESRIEILHALIDGDIQEQLPQHIEELLPRNIGDFSIDEINKLFEEVFETTDWLRDLIYPNVDGPQEAKTTDPLLEARNTHDYGGGQKPTEKEQIEVMKTYRGVFVAYLPRGPQEKAMVRFIENIVSGKTIPSCEKCGEQLAPDFFNMDALHEKGFRHLQEKHPDLFQKMLEAIEKAGKRTRRCPRGWVHEEVLQQLLGDGTRKVKCRCGKVLYDPEKARKGRSDTLQKAA